MSTDPELLKRFLNRSLPCASSGVIGRFTRKDPYSHPSWAHTTSSFFATSFDVYKLTSCALKLGDKSGIWLPFQSILHNIGEHFFKYQSIDQSPPRISKKKIRNVMSFWHEVWELKVYLSSSINWKILCFRVIRLNWFSLQKWLFKCGSWTIWSRERYLSILSDQG